MHQYAGDEAGGLVIRPCKQDTDQECRSIWAGLIWKTPNKSGLKAELPFVGLYCCSNAFG